MFKDINICGKAIRKSKGTFNIKFRGIPWQSRAFTGRGVGLMPDQGIKIPQAA